MITITSPESWLELFVALNQHGAKYSFDKGQLGIQRFEENFTKDANYSKKYVMGKVALGALKTAWEWSEKRFGSTGNTSMKGYRIQLPEFMIDALAKNPDWLLSPLPRSTPDEQSTITMIEALTAQAPDAVFWLAKGGAAAPLITEALARSPDSRMMLLEFFLGDKKRFKNLLQEAKSAGGPEKLAEFLSLFAQEDFERYAKQYVLPDHFWSRKWLSWFNASEDNQLLPDVYDDHGIALWRSAIVQASITTGANWSAVDPDGEVSWHLQLKNVNYSKAVSKFVAASLPSPDGTSPDGTSPDVALVSQEHIAWRERLLEWESKLVGKDNVITQKVLSIVSALGRELDQEKPEKNPLLFPMTPKTVRYGYCLPANTPLGWAAIAAAPRFLRAFLDAIQNKAPGHTYFKEMLEYITPSLTDVYSVLPKSQTQRSLNDKTGGLLSDYCPYPTGTYRYQRHRALFSPEFRNRWIEFKPGTRIAESAHGFEAFFVGDVSRDMILFDYTMFSNSEDRPWDWETHVNFTLPWIKDSLASDPLKMARLMLEKDFLGKGPNDAMHALRLLFKSVLFVDPEAPDWNSALIKNRANLPRPLKYLYPSDSDLPDDAHLFPDLRQSPELQQLVLDTQRHGQRALLLAQAVVWLLVSVPNYKGQRPSHPIPKGEDFMSTPDVGERLMRFRALWEKAKSMGPWGEGAPSEWEMLKEIRRAVFHFSSPKRYDQGSGSTPIWSVDLGKTGSPGPVFQALDLLIEEERLKAEASVIRQSLPSDQPALPSPRRGSRLT